jgi:hypothetical protein
MSKSAMQKLALAAILFASSASAVHAFAQAPAPMPPPPPATPSSVTGGDPEPTSPDVDISLWPLFEVA